MAAVRIISSVASASSPALTLCVSLGTSAGIPDAFSHGSTGGIYVVGLVMLAQRQGPVAIGAALLCRTAMPRGHGARRRLSGRRRPQVAAVIGSKPYCVAEDYCWVPQAARALILHRWATCSSRRVRGAKMLRRPFAALECPSKLHDELTVPMVQACEKQTG